MSSYFRLVKKFPLICIQDDKHLEEASLVIDELLKENLDDGGEQYLDALTCLTEVYEKEHVHFPPVSNIDLLRSLMESNRFTQAALGKEVGISQATISHIMTGRQSLTKNHIVKLSKRFNLSPSVFLS